MRNLLMLGLLVWAPCLGQARPSADFFQTIAERVDLTRPLNPELLIDHVELMEQTFRDILEINGQVNPLEIESRVKKYWEYLEILSTSAPSLSEFKAKNHVRQVAQTLAPVLIALYDNSGALDSVEQSIMRSLGMHLLAEAYLSAGANLSGRGEQAKEGERFYKWLIRIGWFATASIWIEGSHSVIPSLLATLVMHMPRGLNLISARHDLDPVLTPRFIQKRAAKKSATRIMDLFWNTLSLELTDLKTTKQSALAYLPSRLIAVPETPRFTWNLLVPLHAENFTLYTSDSCRVLWNDLTTKALK